MGSGLAIHLTKSHFLPILIDEHIGMIIDMHVG
jgi:hypothetical protein